jgi:hypothetical protein
MSGREIPLDDLPRYSPWPARLLGGEPWQPLIKNPQEIEREFEVEKYGPLLKRLHGAAGIPALEEADAWLMGSDQPVPCWLGERIELLAPARAMGAYRGMVASILTEFLPAAALVELGAGYGGVVLDLGRRAPFRGMPLLAGEYTASGRKLIGLLAQGLGQEITIGTCDLDSPGITGLTVPPGAIIFTCYAAHYVRELTDSFVNALCAFRPSVVVHLEPCLEHCAPDSLLGLMRRRYIEVNDFNRNLVGLLKRSAEAGQIELVAERPCLFGLHPLLTVSLLAWKPAV